MRKFAQNITWLLLPLFAASAGSVCHARDGAGLVHAAAGPVSSPDYSRSADSLNDGPHVFWQSDTSAIVFYLCNDEVTRQTYRVSDTLRFFGFCRDTAVQYVIPAAPAVPGPHVFTGVPKIFAVSDIEGDYEHLVDIFTKGGVIDDSGRWAWGRGHLVVLGDVFDRGDYVTECLWLIRRLETEAGQSGGAVHFVLGNHELMILRGDERYVRDKYLDGIVRATRIKHEDLYGPDMELGRWLRSKHSAVKINDVVFVHGGISPAVIERGLSLADINETVRSGLDLRSSQVAFNDAVGFLFGGEGPLWYRGYHYEMEDSYPMASESQIDSLLSYYGARAVVVGHTHVDQVSGLRGNRVMAIDIPVDELGTLQALLWEGDRFFRVTGTGELQPLD
ncbi:MAG TPA: metallophosphoesterase [Acidobacteriota bacterium]|nr:metallophosphoesterase [Acidobacteriota bacterium]